MRIIGGELKGRIFKAGKNFRARPTTDVAKEGLFNILANRYTFDEINVLDLFAGTGSISYEFASRGCKNITLVESDFVHFKFITQTLIQLQIKSVFPVKANVFQFIKKSREKYNIVFADPPYELPGLKEIPDLIFSSEILKPDAVFILEHPKSYNFSSHPKFQELRRYGNVHFSFFNVCSLQL